jgi:hypothetical protein
VQLQMPTREGELEQRMLELAGELDSFSDKEQELRATRVVRRNRPCSSGV